MVQYTPTRPTMPARNLGPHCASSKKVDSQCLNVFTWSVCAGKKKKTMRVALACATMHEKMSNSASIALYDVAKKGTEVPTSLAMHYSLLRSCAISHGVHCPMAAALTPRRRVAGIVFSVWMMVWVWEVMTLPRNPMRVAGPCLHLSLFTKQAYRSPCIVAEVARAAAFRVVTEMSASPRYMFMYRAARVVLFYEGLGGVGRLTTTYWGSVFTHLNFSTDFSCGLSLGWWS